MKTELIDVSPTRKELKIEIEPEQIRNTYDRISEKYAKAVRVDGFRPGHAPTSVVRARFKSEIRSEVLRELLPEVVNNAIEEHSLAAIGEPDVHLDNSESLDQLGKEPISLKVGVEVFPEIKLDKYKGLEATRRLRPITDADVDRTLEGLREHSASLLPVEDRGSELGDTVTVSLHGTFPNKADEEDIKAEDVELVLGGPGVQQEFTDNLLGTKADEVKKFDVDYPEDYHPKELAGQKVEYEAQVSAVRRKELPEVDDEWAKSLGEEFDSVDKLRSTIREDLEKRAVSEADHRLRADVMAKLLEAHPFEVPESLVEQQASRRLESVVREMIGRGIDPREAGLNWEGARDEMRAQATDDVRATMLLEQIAEEEKIDVSNEEVEAEIDAITTASRQPREQVRAALTKDGGESSIAHRLRNRKALDLLIENAQVTEAPWSEDKDEGGEKNDE